MLDVVGFAFFFFFFKLKTAYDMRISDWSSDVCSSDLREVLVKVERCGVCHSDLHIWEGYFDLGGGKRVVAANNGALLPLTMGHEIVGTVAAIGPEATSAKPGQRRLVFPWIGCGACPPCREGAEHPCAGVQEAVGIFTHGG